MSWLEELIDRLRARLANEHTVRCPDWYLNEPGRQIEAIFEDVSFYGKYCGPRMVTLHAHDDDRIVGVILEGTLESWTND